MSPGTLVYLLCSSLALFHFSFDMKIIHNAIKSECIPKDTFEFKSNQAKCNQRHGNSVAFWHEGSQRSIWVQRFQAKLEQRHCYFSSFWLVSFTFYNQKTNEYLQTHLDPRISSKNGIKTLLFQSILTCKFHILQSRNQCIIKDSFESTDFKQRRKQEHCHTFYFDKKMGKRGNYKKIWRSKQPFYFHEKKIMRLHINSRKKYGRHSHR